MSNTSNNPGCNISFGGINLLTIVFIVLKLCDVVDWSWWWVLAPSWIPFALGFVSFCVWFLIVSVFDSKHGRY